MDYVKFYVKYKTKFGSWTSYSYMGSDSTPTTSGDYYDTWTHPTYYTRMMVMVKAYDSDGHGWDQITTPLASILVVGAEVAIHQ